MKDKLFFFGTYQGTRVRSAAQGQIAQVPTQAERNGDFFRHLESTSRSPNGVPFAGNQIPLSRFSAPGNYFLNSIPLPNGPDTQLTYAGPSLVQNDNQYMAKLDYLRGNHRLSGHYFYSKFDEPPFIASSNVLGIGQSRQPRSSPECGCQPRVLAVSDVAIQHLVRVNQQVGDRFPDASAIRTLESRWRLPNPPELNLVVGGYFDIATSHQGDFDRGDWTIREDVTKVAGAREMHFGGEAVRVRNHVVNTFSMAGGI